MSFEAIESYRQFFFLVNKFSLKRARTLEMTLLCLSHQDTSTDMHHDLFRSVRDLDLRSSCDVDLLSSTNIFFEVFLRKKHDDGIGDYLPLLFPKLFVK